MCVAAHAQEVRHVGSVTNYFFINNTLSTTRTAGSEYVGSVTNYFFIDNTLSTAKTRGFVHVGSVTASLLSVRRTA